MDVGSWPESHLRCLGRMLRGFLIDRNPTIDLAHGLGSLLRHSGVYPRAHVVPLPVVVEADLLVPVQHFKDDEVGFCDRPFVFKVSFRTVTEKAAGGSF